MRASQIAQIRLLLSTIQDGGLLNTWCQQNGLSPIHNALARFIQTGKPSFILDLPRIALALGITILAPETPNGTCFNCGADISGKRRNWKFCGDKCKTEYQQKCASNKRKCFHCKQWFFPQETETICSRACAEAMRRDSMATFSTLQQIDKKEFNKYSPAPDEFPFETQPESDAAKLVSAYEAAVRKAKDKKIKSAPAVRHLYWQQLGYCTFCARGDSEKCANGADGKNVTNYDCIDKLGKKPRQPRMTNPQIQQIAQKRIKSGYCQNCAALNFAECLNPPDSPRCLDLMASPQDEQ